MHSIELRLFFGFFISFCITWYMIPLCIKLAYALRIIDIPDGYIKNHKKPVPYLGGIAMFVGFLTSIAFVLPFENSSLFFLIIGLSLIVVIGFLDDVIVLTPIQKFSGQIIVALSLVKAGFYLKIHAFYNPCMLLVSLLWMLTLMNAFNLVDIMDGLATTLALCSGLLFLITALIFDNHNAALLVISLLGALGAFFYFNKPPASIYMGDTGSLFLGTFFGIIPFFYNWGTYSYYSYCIPLFFLFIPLAEVCWLIVIRTYKGIPFYKGSPDHYALYFKRAGFSVKFILIISLLVSLSIGAAVLILIINPSCDLMKTLYCSSIS